MKRELYDIDWKHFLKCSKCWELKEATTDNFMRKKQNLFWLSWMCKVCDRLYYKDNYSKNKDKILDNHKDYRYRNREVINKKKREYYMDNKDKINSSLRDNRRKHIDDYWFDRTYFHRKANHYAIKHNLKPKYCPICWEESAIELHHPSYDSFDKWSEVVFCCKRCHQNIHSWNIECPHPVDMLNISISDTPIEDLILYLK